VRKIIPLLLLIILSSCFENSNLNHQSELSTSVKVETPSMSVETPSMSVETPSMSVETPSMSVETPSLGTTTLNELFISLSASRANPEIVNNGSNLTIDDLFYLLASNSMPLVESIQANKHNNTALAEDPVCIHVDQFKSEKMKNLKNNSFIDFVNSPKKKYIYSIYPSMIAPLRSAAIKQNLQWSSYDWFYDNRTNNFNYKAFNSVSDRFEGDGFHRKILLFSKTNDLICNTRIDTTSSENFNGLPWGEDTAIEAGIASEKRWDSEFFNYENIFWLSDEKSFLIPSYVIPKVIRGKILVTEEDEARMKEEIVAYWEDLTASGPKTPVYKNSRDVIKYTPEERINAEESLLLSSYSQVLNGRRERSAWLGRKFVGELNSGGFALSYYKINEQGEFKRKDIKFFRDDPPVLKGMTLNWMPKSMRFAYSPKFSKIITLKRINNFHKNEDKSSRYIWKHAPDLYKVQIHEISENDIITHVSDEVETADSKKAYEKFQTVLDNFHAQDPDLMLENMSGGLSNNSVVDLFEL